MDTDLTIQPEASSEDARAHAVPAITWRRELQRWLATLNPGRTPHEYEKAVRYFFETPGVPETLRDVTFDLLLAYRGALALRAMPHHQQPRARSAQTASPLLADTALSGRRVGETSLLGTPDGEREEDDPREHASAATSDAYPDTNGPLAPATVNIRLTALRQFLCWCALNGALPQLSAERVRGALRRLSIERRRPYQVLAEAEWEGFLAAALTVSGGETGDRGGEFHARTDEDIVAPERPQGPWGKTRAERAAAPHQASASPPARATRALETSEEARARLTGRRTRQRDHALIALALGAGLRAIELISLDVGDLRRERHAGQEEWWLVLPDEKTKGQHGGRTLPLAAALVETLLAYIQATGRRWENASDRATPLFLSTRATPGAGATGTRPATSQRRLSPSQVRLIVDRVERQWRESLERERGESVLAGEGRAISPHALRHSTAVALLEGNEAQGRPPASVEHVRGWLGHFDIRTTQGYLAHLDARRHRRPFTLAPTGTRPSSPSAANQADSSPEVKSSD